MLRLGLVLLSLWTGINLAIGIGILFLLLALGRNAPALLILFGDTSARGIEPRALATINAFAVIFNAAAVAICSLALAVIWFAIAHKVRWAFWSVCGSLSFLQAAGFASDSFFQHKDLIANAVSGILLILGLMFTGLGMFSHRANET
jgi:hypothetical protein